MTVEPISILVRRSKCPHCGRTHSRPVRTREHMARCWRNPEARGCLTCRHFQSAESDGPDWSIGYGGHYEPDSCAIDVSLAGDESEGIKPGPIVHCPAWEPRTEEDE